VTRTIRPPTTSPGSVAGGAPQVSVVVPCYNYGRFLSDCVTSLLTQDGVEVEVFIVDDASTDDSVEIATALADGDDRVHLLRHAEHRGHIQTFNDALELARAEFVVKMDADDVVPPGALKRAVDLLTRYPEVAFVYGHPETFTTVIPAAAASKVRSWTLWPGGEWIDRLVTRSHNVIMQPEVVMRRSAIDAVGYHRHQIPEASDLNLWLRLATVGSVARVNGPVQGFYRIHPASLQRTVHAGLLSDLKARVAAFELFIAEYSDALTDAPELLRRARYTLSRDALRIAEYSLDSRQESAETVAQYLAIAAELDPALPQGRRWSATQRRSTRPDRPRERLAAAIRSLQDKHTWRKWRRTGL